MREPILIEASDETLHAFPPGTPETEIERYMWRYENGQDLPDWAFSDDYENARRSCREDVYIPPSREEDADGNREEKIEITSRRRKAVAPVRYEDFRNPGAVFDSREAAAHDIGSQLNPHSKLINKEFGWMYYTDPATGKIGYTDPYQIGEVGGQDIDLGFSVHGSAPLASDGSELTSANTFGMGHTHGARTGNNFSRREPWDTSRDEYDVEFMRRAYKERKWNYFTLGTPSGRFKQWTPEKGIEDFVYP